MNAKKSCLPQCFFTALMLLAFIAFTGCKSTDISIQSLSPMVILSVTGNSIVPWDAESSQKTVTDASDEDENDDTGKGILNAAVTKLFGKENPEVITSQDRIDYAAQALNDLLPLTAGCDVVPHDVLKNSETYDECSRNVFEYMESYSIATDYKSLFRLGAKNARLIMDETGGKSMLMAEFIFNKSIVKGSNWTGTAAAKVRMRVRVLNEKGREIINNEYVAYSNDTIPVKRQSYDKNALVALFPQATDNVINQFIVQYIK